MNEPRKMPALFVAHGSPMVAVEDDAYTRTMAKWGASLPRPEAVVVVSAHWEEAAPIRVTSASRLRTIHDFGGFPRQLYEIKYPAAGNPALAARIAQQLTNGNLPAQLDSERGLDHGAWIPLRLLFPEADVPVVALSLPEPRSPELLLRLGKLLAPLRSQGILLVGTGGMVHNLRQVRIDDKQAAPPSWAAAFDAWVAAHVQERNLAALTSYRSLAPHADMAVPTPEHLDPLFVVLGACDLDERVVTLYEGFHHGSLSMRSFAVGS